MKDSKLSPTSLFILARDQAYFKTHFFSGDRANDLGLVLTEEVVLFPQDDGFRAYNHHRYLVRMRDCRLLPVSTAKRCFVREKK